MTFDHLYDRFKAEIQPLDPSVNHSSSKLMRSQTLRAIPAEILVQAPEVPGFDGWICFLLDNKILYPSPASALAWNPSLYDPGVKSVIIGTTKDEGTLFTRTLGATSVRQWQPCLDRLVDQSLHHEAEAIYGRPQTDAEAQSISTKILAARSSEYPTHALCEGMLAQHGAQREVHRYYIDRPLEAMERLRISPGVPHGTEMAFTLMSDLGQTYMTEEEKEFGHRVMKEYIRFVHGHGFTPLDTTDATSSVFQTDSVAQEHGAKSERVAIIWSQDLKFQTGPFERLDERTLDFWRRNEELELKAQSRFHRSFQEIHSKL
ncbi:hypothetical protein BGZ68_006503 [Mortierella alpina]|nr:hypothetical protein BGZ68_006503 [Mortierella alpina]